MTFQWHIDRGIGHLTLNQPPSNTMSLPFFSEFKALMDSLITEKIPKAIIISGNGRHFSSGADIGELLANANEETLYANYQAFAVLETLEIPVIAAIRGVCLGSALELAMFCHFRICGEDSVLGLPESTYNLIPGIGGIQRLAALSGKAAALQLILRGNTFDAHDAFKVNLVDAIVPKKMLFEAAEEFVHNLPLDFSPTDRKLYIYKFLRHYHATE